MKRPLVFLIVKLEKVFKWQMWRDRTILAESADSYSTAKDARKGIERVIDQIRRNPVSPRILESTCTTH